jgi:hypothetical protein
MIRVIGLAAALSLLLSARPAAAQLRLIPQIGLYTPFAELPSAQAGADELKKDGTFAFGAALELGTPDAVSFRVNVLHATDSDVPVTDIGCDQDCARSSVSTATATLALRPLPNLVVVQPFLLLGGGVKRYDFTREDLSNEGLEAILNDQNQLTGHLGLGAELNLGLLRVVGEVSDLVSQFDVEGDLFESDDLQHDVYFTVGLVIGG